MLEAGDEVVRDATKPFVPPRSPCRACVVVVAGAWQVRAPSCVASIARPTTTISVITSRPSSARPTTSLCRTGQTPPLTLHILPITVAKFSRKHARGCSTSSTHQTSRPTQLSSVLHPQDRRSTRLFPHPRHPATALQPAHTRWRLRSAAMSVRGERIVYRERDNEWEESSAPRTKYTTVKRYQVPEAIQRSSVFRGEDDVEEDKIIIRRERREPSAQPKPKPNDDVEYRISERVRERERPREEIDYSFSERVVERERSPRRDISYRVIERERERDSDHDHRSHFSSRSRNAPRSEVRVIERERSAVRAPSSPSPERENVREFRFERERDFSPARSHRDRDERPYDVERYSKSTEYFAQPQPQPIIITREAAPQPPIIIREERQAPREVIITRREEPHYEFIEREEVKEQSLVKREEPPPPAVSEPPPSAPSHVSEKKEAPEEDYFYERRVIERSREPRHDDIRPRDSASQYSSDDSYEYVRRERIVEGSRERDRSPHHKRHLAEGALAGIAAGEIIRHHKKAQGEKPPGRGRSLVGGAALGAVGAEALSRVRSFRRGSHSRSRSGSRDRSRGDRRDDRRRKHRSRSRSKSLSRAQQLGGLAAIAAVGALAGYAIKKSGDKKETVVINDHRPRRSRSRRRRASADTYAMAEVKAHDQALNPEHRNRRIAQAGLASAAAAGIWERMRSKSRGAKGRSKSRVRQGVPIAAAGLGGAALAGLYEKNKAGKEAKKEAIIAEELGRGRRRRSRSRSRSAPAPYPEDRRNVDDRGLIAYGNDPIYPDSERGYYSDDEPGNYRRRHHGGSDSGSSPDTRRRGSRSRSHNGRRLAETGAAAGAAHEVGRRRERSEQRRRNEEDEQYAYHNAPYGQDPVYSPPPVGNHAGYLPAEQSYGYGNNDQQYPGGHYFPPPPTGENARGVPGAEQQNPYPAYNPADYANGANHQQPYNQQPYGGHGGSDANLGAPYPNDTYAGDQRYGGGHEGHEAENRGRDPENVSAPIIFSPQDHALSRGREAQEDADGMKTPRARSTSRVRFDLGSNTEHFLDASRNSGQRSTDTDDKEHRDDGERKKHRRRKKHHRSHRGEGEDSHRGSPRSNDTSDSDSSGTVELPPRFDEHGNRHPEASGGDALSDKINELLAGHGGLGGLFGGLLGNSEGHGGGGGGGGGNGGDGDDNRSGKRRLRR
nr:hypothetical protein CFP56_02497 [Quercus suber]